MDMFIFYAAFTVLLRSIVDGSTDCNAFQGSCPSNKRTTESHLTYDLTQAADVAKWRTLTQNVPSGVDGAQFVVKQHGDNPTLTSDYCIFYGGVSAEMKAAPGAGIVSSFFLQSEDKDEIDWASITVYLGSGTADRTLFPGSIEQVYRQDPNKLLRERRNDH